MKKLIVLIVGIWLLAACSDEQSKNPDEVIEQAKENGDVVVVHKANTFEKILDDHNIEVHNMEQMVELASHVEKKTKSPEIHVSIVEQNGQKTTNTLAFDGEVMTFENNYEGYPPSPKGAYTCKFADFRGGDLYLEMCTSDEGKEVTSMLGFVGSEEAFKEALKAASGK